jgi:hypothetical protein
MSPIFMFLIGVIIFFNVGSFLITTGWYLEYKTEEKLKRYVDNGEYFFLTHTSIAYAYVMWNKGKDNRKLRKIEKEMIAENKRKDDTAINDYLTDFLSGKN